MIYTWLEPKTTAECFVCKDPARWIVHVTIGWVGESWAEAAQNPVPYRDYTAKLCSMCKEAAVPPSDVLRVVNFERSFTADPADDDRIFLACCQHALAIDAAERLRSR